MRKTLNPEFFQGAKNFYFRTFNRGTTSSQDFFYSACNSVFNYRYIFLYISLTFRVFMASGSCSSGFGNQKLWDYNIKPFQTYCTVCTNFLLFSLTLKSMLRFLYIFTSEHLFQSSLAFATNRDYMWKRMVCQLYLTQYDIGDWSTTLPVSGWTNKRSFLGNVSCPLSCLPHLLWYIISCESTSSPPPPIHS